MSQVVSDRVCNPPGEVDLVIATAINGGPIDRLASELTRRGLRVRVVTHFDSEVWRARMASGRWGRARARLAAMTIFPPKAMLDAVRASPRAAVVPVTNPFFLPLLAVATRRLHGRPVVPLVYDLYPDAFGHRRTGGRQSWLIRLGVAANRYLFARADGIVFIGARMAAHARARYGEPRRWTVIETGVECREFHHSTLGGPEPQTSLEAWCEKRVVASYVGNLGLVHDWGTLAGAVSSAMESDDPSWGLVVVASGPGAAAWRCRWAGISSERLRFNPPLDDTAWARLLLRSDVALVTLREDAAHTSVPSKMFSAMAAGNAILAVAPADSDLAQIVSGTGCGLVVDPGDVTGATEALRCLMEDRAVREACQARSRAAGTDLYDLPLLGARWEAFLRSVADGSRAPWQGQ